MAWAWPREPEEALALWHAEAWRRRGRLAEIAASKGSRGSKAELARTQESASGKAEAWRPVTVEAVALF